MTFYRFNALFLAATLSFGAAACMSVAGSGDADDDGIDNFDDPDDDNDGYKDSVERLCGSDAEDPTDVPTPPPSSDSSDRAQLCRTQMTTHPNTGVDTDRDGQLDINDPDDDQDGFNDDVELACDSNPLDAEEVPEAPDADDTSAAAQACRARFESTLDTDRDGLNDEIDPDDDQDGVSDVAELACGSDPKSSTDKPTVPPASDTSAEANACRTALEEVTDNDNDGTVDRFDTDDDNDTYIDSVEEACGSNPKQASSLPASPAANDTSAAAQACRQQLASVCGSVRIDGHLPGEQCTVSGRTGTCAQGTWQCTNTGIECRSTNVTFEVCDSVDNDCDGMTDNLSEQGCSTGQAGVCAAGRLRCRAGGGSECTRSVEPGTEMCDRLDNDCDGQTDESVPGAGEACQTGLGGGCATGRMVCEPGGLVCRPQNQGEEVCDGADNDCDGSTDEGVPGVGQQCATEGLGRCAIGTQACQTVGQQTSLVCVAQTAIEELCQNRVDDDCDGETDDAATCGCTDGDGDGYGTGGGCLGPDCNDANPNVFPNRPAGDPCDGADNDCDGVTDENFAAGNCTAEGATGACVAGRTQCNGAGGTSCVAGSGSTEVCDNADNDCDGQTDEGEPAGVGVDCVSNAPGACRAGVTACQSGGIVCRSAITPGAQTEECNGQDDDCDGETDETFAIACNGRKWGESCTAGQPCSSGLFCASLGVGSASGTCVRTCTATNECLMGQTCARANASTRVCIALCDPEASTCAVGQTCSADGFCAPQACANSGQCPEGAATCTVQGYCAP